VLCYLWTAEHRTGAEGPEQVKDAETRLKKLEKELQEERQYSSTLDLMRTRAQEQLSLKKVYHVEDLCFIYV
jgi:hypothetical protein